MQRRWRAIILALMLIGIGGCASHENFVKTYNSWVGHNIHHFTAQYGYPDTTYTLNNGHTVYVYEKQEIYSTPSLSPGFGYYGHGGYYGGLSVAYGTDIDYKSCKLFLEVDKKGTIVKWGSRGNSCNL